MEQILGAIRSWVVADHPIARLVEERRGPPPEYRVYWQRLPSEMAAREEDRRRRPHAIVLRETGGSMQSPGEVTREQDVLCICWGPSISEIAVLEGLIYDRLTGLDCDSGLTRRRIWWEPLYVRQGIPVPGIQLTAGGSGYTSPPTVTISSGGSGAMAEADVDPEGEVGRVRVTAGGSGYTSPPTVTFSGGGGSGAMAEADVDPGGEVRQVRVTERGCGYTSAPTVTISDGGSGAMAEADVDPEGEVWQVRVTAGGSGYTSAPTITITGGGGSGATAEVMTATMVHSVGAGGVSYGADPDTGWDYLTRPYTVLYDARQAAPFGEGSVE